VAGKVTVGQAGSNDGLPPGISSGLKHGIVIAFLSHADSSRVSKKVFRLGTENDLGIAGLRVNPCNF